MKSFILPFLYSFFFSSSSPILFSFSSSFSPSCSPLSHPGKRPFGVSILYMGWDPHHGFQLYQSDPSGNYGGWKATCIGSNHQVNGRMFCLAPTSLLSLALHFFLPRLLPPLYLPLATQAAVSMLKQEYKEPPTLKEALELAIKVLNKTLDSTKLNAEKGMIHLSTNVEYSCTIPLLPLPSSPLHQHTHTSTHSGDCNTDSFW